jgi:DNA-binding GntR family transcriptional regulator
MSTRTSESRVRQNVSGRASDSILAELRRKIVTLELRPGAVVTESYLTELLECSRTPLREALQRLAQEHLVVAVPRRGVTIAEMGVMDFGSLMEAIQGVYQNVAELACARISKAQLGELERILAASVEAEAAGDFATAAELDFHFHHALAKAADNHYLLGFQDTLQRLVVRFVFLGYKRANTAAGTISDHEVIIRALRSGRTVEAVEAVSTHCDHGRERMRAAL